MANGNPDRRTNLKTCKVHVSFSQFIAGFSLNRRSTLQKAASKCGQTLIYEREELANPGLPKPILNLQRQSIPELRLTTSMASTALTAFVATPFGLSKWRSRIWAYYSSHKVMPPHFGRWALNPLIEWPPRMLCSNSLRSLYSKSEPGAILWVVDVSKLNQAAGSWTAAYKLPICFVGPVASSHAGVYLVPIRKSISSVWTISRLIF